MDVLDISVTIDAGTIVYPGVPEVRLEWILALADGGIANVSRLDFGVHAGTHLDAPLQSHVESGELPPRRRTGRARRCSRT